MTQKDILYFNLNYLRVLRTNQKKYITINDIIEQAQTSMMAEANMLHSNAQLNKFNEVKKQLDIIDISDTNKANITFIESLTTKALPFLKRNKKKK